MNDMTQVTYWKLILIGRLGSTLVGAFIGGFSGIRETGHVNFILSGLGALIGCLFMRILALIFGVAFLFSQTYLRFGLPPQFPEYELSEIALKVSYWGVILVSVIFISLLFLDYDFIMMSFIKSLKESTFIRLLLFIIMMIIAIGYSLREAIINVGLKQ